MSGCQFCMRDAIRLREALKFIVDGYANQDVNHVDFRVRAYQVATEALATLTPAKRGGQ